MRVSVVNLHNFTSTPANLKSNFKSRKKNTQAHKQNVINSLDPKALAIAAALVTMTPSCSNNQAEKIKQPTDPVMTYVSERYGEYDNDSVRDEKRYYFAQLADLIDTDKAMFAQTGRNTFKGDIEFENYKVNLNIASASDDLKNFSGLVSVANKQWNSRETYNFDAQILDKYNTNLKLRNIVDGSEAEEYLIHRNFDGQLFAIDKTNNSVTVLNKAFWEEVRQKEAEIKDKQKDKDDMISLIAISSFSIFAGYIFGIKAGLARKINKNANTKN